MIVERVARAMTEGSPRAGFTARVMAPIHGRPQPGFTARVMAGLDAPRPRAGVRTLGPALLAAGAVAIAAAALLLRPAGVAMPGAPDAPSIAAKPYDRELIGIPPLPYNRWAPEVPAPPTRTARTTPVVPVVPVAEGAGAIVTTIYRIEALAPPRELAIASIDAPAATVARLPQVPPIRVSELRLDKENP